MLRSIFSLIQRMVDSDKKYNNTKSKAVIYCFTNPNNTINMDLEINGKTEKSIRNIEYVETKPIEKGSNSFQIKTEQGDTVTCKYQAEVNIRPKGIEGESGEQRVTFSNSEELLQCEEKSETAEEINVQDLINNFPKKQMEICSKGKDQIASLLEQIQKMKTGLERLQEIALQFNSSDRFSEDINFLIHNVKKSLYDAEKERGHKQNISPKS